MYLNNVTHLNRRVALNTLPVGTLFSFHEEGTPFEVVSNVTPDEPFVICREPLRGNCTVPVYSRTRVYVVKDGGD